MNTKIILISKWIKVLKVCKSNIEIEKFKRDIPAKYNLLFSDIPYVIQTTYL